uniref:Uncharacterized protein n=1 Tax=Leersia perrieri TaxID=77586 RepID=A0A0D9X6B1_9ORYZ
MPLSSLSPLPFLLKSAQERNHTSLFLFIYRSLSVETAAAEEGRKSTSPNLRRRRFRSPMEVEQDVRTKIAAEILVSLMHRRMRRPPEWRKRRDPVDGLPDGEEEEEEEDDEVVEDVVVDLFSLLPETWLNRGLRSPRMPARPSDLAARLRIGVKKVHGVAPAAAAETVMPPPPPVATRKVVVKVRPARRPLPEYGAGAGSGVVKPTVKAEPAAASSYYAVEEAGSGGGDRLCSRSRSHRSEKEHAKASSPETPLDYAPVAAGSGSSSSGDDGTQPSRKRKAAAGDEGCTSPEKKPHIDAGVHIAAAETERAKFSDTKNGNTKDVLMFDLNEFPEDWED